MSTVVPITRPTARREAGRRTPRPVRGRAATHARRRPGVAGRATPVRRADDETLVARLRTGDDRAADELHRRHQPALLAHARRVLGAAARDRAEDVVQDAWLRGLVALRRDDRDIRFRPWMLTIVRHRCFDRLRDARPAPLDLLEGVLDDACEDVARTAAARETLDHLLGALDELPARQRQAFVGHVLGGASHAALSASLGTTVPATKTLVARARASLVLAAAAA